MARLILRPALGPRAPETALCIEEQVREGRSTPRSPPTPTMMVMRPWMAGDMSSPPLAILQWNSGWFFGLKCRPRSLVGPGPARWGIGPIVSGARLLHARPSWSWIARCDGCGIFATSIVDHAGPERCPRQRRRASGQSRRTGRWSRPAGCRSILAVAVVFRRLELSDTFVRCQEATHAPSISLMRDRACCRYLISAVVPSEASVIAISVPPPRTGLPRSFSAKLGR